MSVISNLIGLIKSYWFAAGKISRSEIEWDKLENDFIQCTSFVLAETSEPVEYEKIALTVGNQLSQTLYQKKLKVSKEQSSMVFSALSIICMDKELQKRFIVLQNFAEEVIDKAMDEGDPWSDYDKQYRQIKNDLSKFGIVFGPELTIEEIQRKIINEMPK